MALYICSGYWKDDSTVMQFAESHGARREFIGEIICNDPCGDGSMEEMMEELMEELEEDDIFWFIDDGMPIIGDHDELVIESAQEITLFEIKTRAIN